MNTTETESWTIPADVSCVFDHFSSHTVSWMIWMAFLIVTGIPGNLLIIVIFTKRNKTLPLVSNIFITFLGFIDLVICSLSMPLIVYDTVCGTYSEILCKIEIITTYALTVGSATMFAVIAMERYFSICRPHKPLSLKQAKIIISAVVLFCMVIGIMSIPTHAVQQYGCNVTTVPLTDVVNIFLVLFNVGLIITVVSLYSAVYRIVYIRAKSKRAKVQPATSNMGPETSSMQMDHITLQTEMSDANSRHPGTSSGTAQSINSTDERSAQSGARPNNQRSTNVRKNQKAEEKSELRILSMLFTITVIYVVSFIPFWLITFDIIAKNEFLLYMFFVNNCSNCIVYLVMNVQIRKEARTIVCGT